MRVLALAAVLTGAAALIAVPTSAEAKSRHHRGHSSVRVGVYPNYAYNNYAYGYRPVYRYSGYQPYYGYQNPYGYSGYQPYGYGNPYGYGAQNYGMSKHQRKHMRRQMRHQTRHH